MLCLPYYKAFKGKGGKNGARIVQTLSVSHCGLSHKRGRIPKCGLQGGADSRQINKGTRGSLLPPVFLGVRERVIQTLCGVHSDMRSQQNSLEPATLSSSLSMLDGFLCRALN